MSLGNNTLTLTIGEEPKVLNRINQDNYATRYYLHDGLQEFTVVVRHSREKLRGVQYDVHNIELQRVVFATLTAPADQQFCWFSVRNQASTPRTELADQNEALVALLDSSTLTNLVNWVG